MTPRRRLMLLLALSLGLGCALAAAVAQRPIAGPRPPAAPSAEAWAASSHDRPRYVVTDLGSLRGSPFVEPFDINNAGQVVGDATFLKPSPAERFRALVRRIGLRLDNPPRIRTAAFLWEAGRMRRLAGLNRTAAETHASAINERGEIAGTCQVFLDVEGTIVPSTHACLWQGTGRPRGLGTLGGEWSAAVALNDRGQVVGASGTGADAETYPFLWQGGTMRRLGDKPGWAQAVNGRGEVAGDAPGHLFLWAAGARRELTGLGGENSRIGGMNDRGQIVGTATLAPRGDPVADLEAMRVFLWNGSRGRPFPADLGRDAQASDINRHGHVVGSMVGKAGRRHAFLWRGDALYDLQDLLPRQDKDGWLLEDARAVNDRGQVVGVGRFGPRRGPRAFLLTPTR